MRSLQARKRSSLTRLTWIASLWLGLASLSAQASEVILDEDMSPLVKTLSRPVDVFHWATREQLDVPQPKKALAYVEKKIDLFWQPFLAQSGILGNGLYAATDPVVGRLSGEDWALIRFTLPRGFRFLDIRASERRIPLSTVGLDRLRAAHCAATSLAELLAPNAGPSCRKIAADSLKILQADAVLYTGAIAGLEHCPRALGSAFLIVDGTRFLPDGFAVFTRERGPQAPSDPQLDDRLSIQALFLDSTHRNSGDVPWPELRERRPSKDVATYEETSVFGCGLAEEDRYPDPEAAISYAYQAILRRFEAVSRRLKRTIDPLRIWDHWRHRDGESVRTAARLGQALGPDGLKGWSKGLEPEMGFLHRESALDAEGVDAIQFFKFQGEEQPGLRWVDAICADGAAPEGRYCGRIADSPNAATLTEIRLKRIFKRVADYFSSYTSDRSDSALRLAIRTERELAALHFPDGVAGEYIVSRAGLPPIPAAELAVSEEKSIRQSSDAAFETLTRLHACVRRYETEDFMGLQSTECGLWTPPGPAQSKQLAGAIPP
jgi:hypothetical protein